MTSTTGRADRRRIIKVGGPNAPKVMPIYSIPLQTTATISIQIGNRTERTNAAGIGTGVPIRTGPHGSELAQKGILKSSRGGGEGVRKSAAGTLASGDVIIPQIVPVVASSRQNAHSNLTSADVHVSSDDIDEYARSRTYGALNGSGDTGVYDQKSIQTEGRGNLSDVLQSKRASAMSTQVEETELVTSVTPATDRADSIYGRHGKSGSVASESGSTTRNSVSDAENPYDVIETQVDPTYATSAASQLSSKEAERVRSTAPIPPVGNTSDIYGKLPRKSKTNGEKENDGDQYLENHADANSFRFIGWDVDQEQDEDLPCQRVLVMKEPDMVLMFTARCTTEAVGNDSRLHNLMVDIADSCVKRLRILMKDIATVNIAAESMETLPLSDGRHTKIHLDELSAKVSETISITDVAFRFQPPEGVYLGTFVQGTVVAKRNYAIGKVGVVAVLTKKNKFATVEAFSEQLCEHIANMKPANLGTMRGNNTKNMTKSAMAQLQDQQRDQLLLQNFMFDPTIVVAEAARRSFVKIDGFLLFK